MHFLIIGIIILSTNQTPLFTTQVNNITQSVYQNTPNLYFYTYSNPQTDTHKVYRFTTEEIITCFTQEVTVNSFNYVYINLVLISFSVQFPYQALNTVQIQTCSTLANEGIYNPLNHNQRLFHNNMLNFNRYIENFQNNMFSSFDDSYQLNEALIQADFSLIQNQQFLDQNKYFNDKLTLDKYLIQGTHNSYLEDNEFFGISVSERSIIRQLNLGFRFFELDIWPVSQPSGSNFSVYVSIQHKNGPLSTNNIDLKSAMKIIADYGFENYDSPIILFFENHLSTLEEYQYFIDALEQSQADIIMATDLLNFQNQIFKNLKNKIIINMRFNEDDKNLTVTPINGPIDNANLYDTYQNQYIQDPLDQFLSGFSYLTHMTNQIFQVSQTELQNIIDNNDANLIQTIVNKNSELKNIHLKKSKDLLTFPLASILPGNYYSNNEALKYISIIEDCYPEVRNYIFQSFSERVQFQDLEQQIESINNSSTCKQLLRVYTAFYRYISGNYNPLDGVQLNINIMALNGQNIDNNVIDYINLFTSRNGYKQISKQIHSKKKYKIEIDQIYIPSQYNSYYINIYIQQKDQKYQLKNRIGRQLIVISNGRNTRNLESFQFFARKNDFISIQIGDKYRYSFMFDDIYISNKNDISLDIYQAAILRVVKNYFWDGAFMKIRIRE